MAVGRSEKAEEELKTGWGSFWQFSQFRKIVTTFLATLL